ncbi:MAG: hypothetical protein MJZ29_02915 [Bacteroidaceae bacterium]|nr:hypothetical protein [Bacteroidaceae bacterium]
MAEEFDNLNSIGTYINGVMTKSKAFLRSRFSSMSESDIEEIFGNSEIALFEKVHRGELQVAEGKIKILNEGKLEDLRSTLLTYFNKVTWFQALKYLRSKGNNANHPNQNDRLFLAPDDRLFPAVIGGASNPLDDQQIDALLSLTDDDGLTNEQKSMMRDIVKDLPSPCEEILWSFYGDGMDMKTIAQIIGSKNAAVAKQQKSRCMSKLRARFEKIKAEFYDTRD